MPASVFCTALKTHCSKGVMESSLKSYFWCSLNSLAYCVEKTTTTTKAAEAAAIDTWPFLVFLVFQVFIHYKVMNAYKKPVHMSSFCNL